MELNMRELQNETGLMMAIVEKNQIIMNQGKMIDEKNKEISDLRTELANLKKTD